MNIKHELCLLNVGVHQLATFSTENYTLIVVGPLALDSSGRGPETTYSMGFLGGWNSEKWPMSNSSAGNVSKTVPGKAVVAKGYNRPF